MVESGQSRVPAPPAKITGRIGRLSFELLMHTLMRANDRLTPAFIFLL
jgi:hypothetical protein